LVVCGLFGQAWASDGGRSLGDAGISQNNPAWRKTFLLSRAGDVYAKGKYDEAATLFRSVLRIDATDETALRHLAAIALKKGDLPQAAALLQVGADANPGSFPLHHELGAVLLRQGKAYDAAAHFRTAMAAAPDSVDAAVNLGDALKVSGVLPQAIEAYRTALQRDPTSSWAMRQLGYALFDAKAYAEAVTRLSEAAKAFPKESSLWMVLGHAALQDNQLSVAQKAYEKAVALSPKSSDAQLFLGLAHEKQRAFSNAIVAYLRSIELSPQNPIPKIHLGNAYRLFGDLPRARTQYQKAGSHPWALAQLGFLELEAGRDDEAEKALRRAAQVAPDNADVGEVLGDLKQKRKDFGGAEQEYRRVLKQHKRHLGARVKLGDVLRHLGKLEDAVDAYRIAAAQHPSSVWAHVAFGDGRRALGQLPEAIQEYRSALSLEPSSVWAQRQLGLALFDASDDSHAKSLLLQLPPDVIRESDVQVVLGHLARREGSLDRAKTHYRSALSANPDHPGALISIADVDRALGDLGEALGAIRKATAITNDTNPDAWTLRGDIASLALDAEGHANVELEEEAVTSYERALRLAPNDLRARRQLAFFSFLHRRDAQAEALLDTVVKGDPADLEAVLALGHIAVRQKRLSDALSRYERAKKLAPNDVRPLGFLGSTLRALERLPESKETLEQAVALRPDSAWAQLELGYTSFALRNTRRALAAAEVSVKLDDSNPEAWLFLSRMRQRLTQTPGAVEAAQRAVALAPKHAMAHRALAAALLDRGESGDRARAVTLLEPFIPQLENEALTFLIHGHLLAKLSTSPGEDLPKGSTARPKAKGQQAEEKRKAMVSFERALELAGHEDGPRLSVGQGFVDLQENARAKQTLEPLVASNLDVCPKDEFSLEWDVRRSAKTEREAETPEEAAALERKAVLSRAHLLLGELAEREQREAQSRFEYACAIALAPDTAEAHLKLGLAYENKGLIRLAEEHAAQALQLNSDLRPAREAVERLRREVGFPVGPVRLAGETSFTSDPLPLEILANVVRVTGVDGSDRERLLTVPRTIRLGAAAAWRPEERPDLPRFELQYDGLLGFGTFLTDRLQFENTVGHAGSVRSNGRVQLNGLNRAELNWRGGYRLLGASAPSRTELRHTVGAGARLVQLQWGAFDGQLEYERGDYQPVGNAELVERSSNAIIGEFRYFPTLKWRRIEGFAGYRFRGVFLGSGRTWWNHRFDVDALWRGEVALFGAELNGGIGADRFPAGGPSVDAASVGALAKAGVGLNGYTFALGKTGFTFVPGNSVFDAFRVGVDAQHRVFFRKGELSLALSAGYEFRWLYNARHVDHLFMAFLTFGR
jgi:tetratricopeptide (TPR) repeat protein